MAISCYRIDIAIAIRNSVGFMVGNMGTFRARIALRANAGNGNRPALFNILPYCVCWLFINPQLVCVR